MFVIMYVRYLEDNQLTDLPESVFSENTRLDRLLVDNYKLQV